MELAKWPFTCIILYHYFNWQNHSTWSRGRLMWLYLTINSPDAIYQCWCINILEGCDIDDGRNLKVDQMVIELFGHIIARRFLDQFSHTSYSSCGKSKTRWRYNLIYVCRVFTTRNSLKMLGCKISRRVHTTTANEHFTMSPPINCNLKTKC